MVTITTAMRQKVCALALQQVGKPYIDKAAGPDAFDCSGLPEYCWQSVGVTLPHNSELQAEPRSNPYARFVAYSQANWHQTLFGDLLIYYPDWSHVAMLTNFEEPGEWWRVTQATNPQRGVENIRAAAYATPVGIVLLGH
jgi:cell wall-associated NlpC family hydrolase